MTDLNARIAMNDEDVVGYIVPLINNEVNKECQCPKKNGYKRPYPFFYKHGKLCPGSICLCPVKGKKWRIKCLLGGDGDDVCPWRSGIYASLYYCRKQFKEHCDKQHSVDLPEASCGLKGRTLKQLTGRIKWEQNLNKLPCYKIKGKVNKKKRVQGVCSAGRRHNLNTDQKPNNVPSAIVSRRAMIGKGVKIYGDVSIGKGSQIYSRCKIQTGTKIGNDVKICSDSKIGKEVIIHNNVWIATDVKIGPNTIIAQHTSIHHKARIGSNVNIGRNSIIQRGAKINDNTKIEAFSVISKNTVIKPANNANN